MATKKSAGSPPARRMLPVLLGVLAGALVVVYFPNSGYHAPDGIGYFSHLPAVWTTRDLDVLPWFERFGVVFPVGLSERGYAINVWPAGTAMVWSWGYLLSQLLAEKRAMFVLTNFVSSLAGITAALLTVLAVRRFGLGWRTAAGCGAAAWFGTPLFFYSFCMTQSAHPTTAMLAAVFLGSWMFTYGDRNPWRWSLLGVLLGIMASVRPQEALNGLVLLLESFDGIIIQRQRFGLLVRLMSRAVGGALIGYAPQMAMTWQVHGAPWVQAQGFNVGIENFSGLDTLLSPYHGVLWWTPAMLLGFAGLLAGVRRHGMVSVGLAAVCAAQVGVNAFVTAFWNGNSFGIRLLTGTAFAVGVGIAFGAETLRDRRLRTTWFAVVAVCCLWTCMLSFGVAAGGIDSSSPYTVASFLKMAAGVPAACVRGMRFMAKPREPEFLWVAAGMIGGAVWIIRKGILWWRRGRFRRLAWVPIAASAVWAAAIVTTVWNRPVYTRRQATMLVTPQDQRNCFLLADLLVRARYHRMIGDHRAAERMERRARSLTFRAPFARWFAYQRFTRG
jgi:hypothetical protein